MQVSLTRLDNGSTYKQSTKDVGGVDILTPSLMVKSVPKPSAASGPAAAAAATGPTTLYIYGSALPAGAGFVPSAAPFITVVLPPAGAVGTAAEPHVWINEAAYPDAIANAAAVSTSMAAAAAASAVASEASDADASRSARLVRKQEKKERKRAQKVAEAEANNDDKAAERGRKRARDSDPEEDARRERRNKQARDRREAKKQRLMQGQQAPPAPAAIDADANVLAPEVVAPAPLPHVEEPAEEAVANDAAPAPAPPSVQAPKKIVTADDLMDAFM